MVAGWSRWLITLGFLGLAGFFFQCEGPVQPDESVVTDGGQGTDAPTGNSWQAMKLQQKDGVLLDEKGRQVLLRGMNARVEGIFDVTFDDGRKALEPIPPFGESDCKVLAQTLGHNLLRLPVNWSAIEPKKGQFNQAYLDRIFALVDLCYKHGVYTLVDLHQDAYSKEIGEDGAPLWAIVPPPEKLLEGPLHDLEKRRTSKQVLAAFESFFANKQNLQDDYARMSAHLVKQFKGHPGAIGFEIMNEPVLFGDNKALDDFHKKVTEKVRAVQSDLLVFFEPNSLRNLTDRMEVTTPFPFSNGVYSPHIYTEVFQNGWESKNVEAIRKSVLAAKEEAKKHKSHLFVGEFGNDPKKDRGRLWVEESLKLFDEVQASWALWLYEEYSQGSWGLYDAPKDGKRGTLRDYAVALAARPFPSRTAGRIDTILWDKATKTLSVTVKNATSEQHEFTVPEAVFANGVKVTCDGKEVETTAKPGRVWFICQGKSLVMSAK